MFLNIKGTVWYFALRRQSNVPSPLLVPLLSSSLLLCSPYDFTLWCTTVVPIQMHAPANRRWWLRQIHDMIHGLAILYAKDRPSIRAVKEVVVRQVMSTGRARPCSFWFFVTRVTLYVDVLLSRYASSCFIDYFHWNNNWQLFIFIFFTNKLDRKLWPFAVVLTLCFKMKLILFLSLINVNFIMFLFLPWVQFFFFKL